MAEYSPHRIMQRIMTFELVQGLLERSNDCQTFSCRMRANGSKGNNYMTNCDQLSIQSCSP